LFFFCRSAKEQSNLPSPPWLHASEAGLDTHGGAVLSTQLICSKEYAQPVLSSRVAAAAAAAAAAVL
jgi:hypothetical protein